ncbi:fatty acyl-AMP ligase [Legionella fallonii]|uniref:AMP-dependent synthetase and ligase n=1 Tax=Legionella fallonii LLAP-10 TaxID=1212491 RepID=A0A098G363_9GAMM|nr:fatty acyl-AMP ligase [Legionella fallonii]CEG56898.1 AMP-dependent synthetase and ligase [Legionella fallonii LLAP-10]
MSVQVRNMVELFQERVQKIPEKNVYYFSETGLHENNVAYSYGSLEEKIMFIAALIQEHTTPGDRVLMIFAPGMDYLVAFWACLYAGVIAVPAYPPFNKNTIEKIQAIIENATPTVILSNTTIITSIKRLGMVKRIAENRLMKKLLKQFASKTVELLEWDFKNFFWLDINQIKHFSGSWKAFNKKPEDIAYLQYTSGSTSMPKGVMVSHENILANMELVHQTIGKTTDERLVSWLPPYHDMGLISSLLFPVYCDYQVMMMSPVVFLRAPFLWLKAISEFQGTISGGPNFAFDLCTNKINEAELNSELNLNHWRVAYNGAEPIQHNTLENFSKKFAAFGFKKTAFYPIYGLAESTVYVSGEKVSSNEPPHYLYVDKESLQKNKVVVNSHKEDSKILVSCGKPKMPARIIVDFPTAKICDEGVIGEIWLNGSSVAKGYWHKEHETQESFLASLTSEPDTYYLRTGDLGFILDGNLYVTGRIKDLIIINGKNYYPQDIELVVEASHPSIRSGCSVAYAISGDDKEEVTVVAEVKNATSIIFPEIAQKIYEQVNLNFGIPIHEISLCLPKNIPKTTSGKLRRSHTKLMIENNQLPVLFKWNPVGI